MNDDVRYELDHDGQIIEGQAALCRDQNQLLLEMFSQFGNECSIENKKGSLTELSVRNPKSGERRINVFHGNIRNEKRNPYEKKIQLGSNVDPRQYDKANTLILGIYMLEDDDLLKNAIIIGFPIDSKINYPTNPSLRGGLFVNQLLQKAKFNGFCVDKASGLVGFRPEFIFYYLDNHLELHQTTPSGSLEPKRDISCIRNKYNLIYFGAPGTGKSYNLQQEAAGAFDEDKINRVTFHPDYTYSQFVGSLRPHTDQVESGKTQVYYAYTPGPFIETYVDAIKNPDQNYLLIIEELNRANPAAVFGDVFQLLDRDSEGNSDYPVRTSDELRQYLANEFIALVDAEKLAGELSIPSNMYIWATMNSADQGVFPMDTAFKRRWDFRYMGINDGEHVIEDKKVKLNNGEHIYWNDLRKGINSILLDARINEDKLLGPFFIDPDLLNDEDFNESFKSKVLLYLIEDAAKTKKEKVFDKSNVTYSIISGDFDVEGTRIFKGLGDISIETDFSNEEEVATNEIDD